MSISFDFTTYKKTLLNVLQQFYNDVRVDGNFIEIKKRGPNYNITLHVSISTLHHGDILYLMIKKIVQYDDHRLRKQELNSTTPVNPTDPLFTKKICLEINQTLSVEKNQSGLTTIASNSISLEEHWIALNRVATILDAITHV